MVVERIYHPGAVVGVSDADHRVMIVLAVHLAHLAQVIVFTGRAFVADAQNSAVA